METKITQWLQSHRHAEYFKAQMLANTEYTSIAEYVEATNRSRIIIEATQRDDISEPQPQERLDLFSEFQAFLKEFAIENVKEYLERKIARYKPFRITKQGIIDIIDYCVLYGLTQNETSRLLDSVIHLVESRLRFERPSKTAFALTVLWVQVWQCRVFTDVLRAKFKAHGFNTNIPEGATFKEFNQAFAAEVERVKSEYYGEAK